MNFHEFGHTSESSSREKTCEVGFLTVRGRRLLLVEVKSSGCKARKSLDNLTEEYDMKLEEKMVLRPKDVARESQVTYLPFCMAMRS